MTIFDDPAETKSPLDNTVDLGGYELSFKNYCKVQAPNILCELWKLCYPGKTIHFQSKQFLQLKLIVSDLYSCHCSGYEFIRYSRKCVDYTGSSNLSYRIAINIIDTLIENGYVFSIIGQQLAQRTSRMKATDKLIDLIGDHSLVVNRKISRDDNFVILRSEKEKLEGRKKKIAHDLSYEPNDFTIKNNNFLFDYNTMLSNTSFKVGDEFKPVVSFDRNVMKTVFNDGSFSKGGRFCGTWWLECKSEIRKSILIDNEETCEVDYKCSHPTIAYALKGTDVSNQDLYAITTIKDYDTKDNRKLIKKVLLTCLNAVSKNSAAKAIETNFLEYTIKKHKKRKDKKILKRHPDYTVYQIINLIKEFHPNIQEFLYNDSGKNLMFLEREIVFDVLNHFLKKDILVLPVHDSFVIKKKYQKELEEVMLSIFKTKMNVNINIETITKNTKILSSNSSNLSSKSYNLNNTINTKESSFHYISGNVLIKTDTYSIDNSTNVMGNVLKKDSVNEVKLEEVGNVLKKDSVNVEEVGNVLKKDSVNVEEVGNVLKKDSVNELSIDQCLGFFSTDEQPIKENTMSLREIYEAQSIRCKKALKTESREMMENMLRKIADDPTFFTEDSWPELEEEIIIENNTPETDKEREHREDKEFFEKVLQNTQKPKVIEEVIIQEPRYLEKL